jgi:hypothetical protein
LQWAVLLCTQLILHSVQVVCAQNFIVENLSPNHAKPYLEAAERDRNDIAVFWTGKPLRGNWFKPCHMKIRVGNSGNGGTTSFQFNRGQVYGWRMTVQGTKQQLLESIIPHEVHHTVMASLCRRKLPRWLDEGSAIVFESRSEHQQQRELARQLVDGEGNVFQLFDHVGDYPDNMQHVVAMYSTGFTFVEWMLERGGRERLYAFIKDTLPPSRKFQRHYGMAVSEARKDWRRWSAHRPTDCRRAGCYLHGSHRVLKPFASGKAVLSVFVASRCLPCQAFKADYGRNRAFRERLHDKYNVVFIDVNQQPVLARRKGILGVPTFCPDDVEGCVVGYCGRSWLLDKLSRLSQAPKPQPKDSPPKPKPQLPRQPDCTKLLEEMKTLRTQVAQLKTLCSQKADHGKCDTAATHENRDVIFAERLKKQIEAVEMRLRQLEGQVLTVEIYEAGRVVQSQKVPLKDGVIKLELERLED